MGEQPGTSGGGYGDGSGFLNIGKERLAPFTYRSMRALRLARDEAATLGHTVIEPAHVLFGVMAMADGAGAVVLANLGIVASELSPALAAAPAVAAEAGESPALLSPETNRVLDHAIEEGERLGHAHIGTEHLLLGLLRERGSAAERALTDRGVTLDGARAEVVNVLATWLPGMKRGKPGT